MKHTILLLLSVILTNVAYTQTANDYVDKAFVKMEIFNDYKGAIMDLTNAIEIDPKFAEAYFFRGIAKGTLDDFRGAISDHTKAIEINPEFTDAYYGRGLAKIWINRKHSGCLDIKRAQSLGSDQAYIMLKKFCH